MSSYPEYLIAEVERLVESVQCEERILKSNLLPFARQKVMNRLSYLRKHINGMCKVARMAGATDGMIQDALAGKVDVFLCPVCATEMVDTPDFKDEHGECFLECPSCNKEKKDD